MLFNAVYCTGSAPVLLFFMCRIILYRFSGIVIKQAKGTPLSVSGLRALVELRFTSFPGGWWFVL